MKQTWLTGACRREHSFITAPNPRLLRSILGLSVSQQGAAEAALSIASDLAQAMHSGIIADFWGGFLTCFSAEINLAQRERGVVR
jgi:hypothetical protein